jgi:hypothetical protein
MATIDVFGEETQVPPGVCAKAIGDSLFFSNSAGNPPYKLSAKPAETRPRTFKNCRLDIVMAVSGRMDIEVVVVVVEVVVVLVLVDLVGLDQYY